MSSSRRLTAGQVAELAGGELIGNAEVVIAGLAPLDRAGPGDLSFLVSPKYLRSFHESHAGVVLTTPEFRNHEPGPATRVVVPSPYAALVRVLPALHPVATPPWGVDRTAEIGAGTRWEGRIALGAGVVVGRNVRFGVDCVLHQHVVVGDDVTLGDGCWLDAQAVVEGGAKLGARVVLHAGARVGTPGYGYVEVESGHERIPHFGKCILGDDVEIGANTTVDRGGVGDTEIGAGTKVDNLVQIAHNVRIGERCLILAQVGIAGSTVIEDEVILAGQAGLAGHLTVGRRARIGAQAGVIGDIAPGATVSGYPARRHREVLRHAAVLRRLSPIVSRLEAIAEGRGGGEPHERAR